MVTLGELLERAEQGEAQAFFELGLAYSAGMIVDTDLEQAVAYFRRAYELGLEEPIYYLARAYEDGGPGLERDPTEAFTWWRQAAIWGRSAATSQAYYRVGRAYAEGVVVVRDRNQAILWLEKAVNNGENAAQALLDELKNSDN
jgi:TPR repeat protein